MQGLDEFALRWEEPALRGALPMVPREALTLAEVRRADLPPDLQRIFAVREEESRRGRKVGVLALWRSRFPPGWCAAWPGRRVCSVMSVGRQGN